MEGGLRLHQAKIYEVSGIITEDLLNNESDALDNFLQRNGRKKLACDKTLMLIIVKQNPIHHSPQFCVTVK